jgi:two-component system, NtrC family, sensor kinase
MGFFISLYLAFRLRRTLQQGIPGTERWDKIFKSIMVICGVLLILNISLNKFFPVELIGFGIMAWLFWIIWNEDQFQHMRTIMFSVAPLGVAYFIKFLPEFFLPAFFEEYGNYFEIVKVVGWVWFFATLIMYRRQMKALEAEQALRAKEAKENLINAARKAELEVLVTRRTAQISEQNEKLKQALEDLSAAQTQLIHSEKMASLGELTAGIAHEIQNPLNFVNNFSELNAELASELVAALASNDVEEARVIANDIKDNQLKVVHHGKRADSIVKSMLQHSRGTTTTRESVSINALADECIRLSYHGMRAKEKSFNAKMETKFEEAVGMVEVVPGDLSRVLLNICTNAFYAVMQRAKNKEPDYQPTVWLETGVKQDKVWISIRDNGKGIPADAMDKIFQPFFTTKPTGEGTGLGLSMSYEIITKGHGGDIKVSSKEGEGATFLIELPLNN